MRALTTLSLMAMALAACGRGAATAQAPDEVSMQLRSTAFSDHGEIPTRYTCEGAGVSPPLQWSALPEGTRSLALIVDDPDAPDPAAPRRIWVHWVLFNLPPSPSQLAEGIRTLPLGAAEGVNDWQRTGYGGPCPPMGRHRYFHRLYALDTELELNRPTKAQLEQAMDGHVLAQAVLIGTYQKRHK
jgi:Raf kinase inhibitor-like YbhB/YbcL family protein